MPQDTSNQLTISFDHDPLITDSLYGGEFLFHIELQLPEEKVRWENAQALIRWVNQRQLPHAGFTIRRALKTKMTDLESLKQSTQAPFLVTLPGTRSSVQTLREDAATARSFGVRNFLAVTGNMDPLHLPQPDGTYAPLPAGYTDSLTTLQALNAPHKPQALAAVVNPYMYTPEMQSMQYTKLMRKINTGAQFLIAQAGWDMKKAQELQWFLQMRETVIPILARIRLESPESAAHLPQPEPGVRMPIPIAATLQRLAGTPADFNDYQTYHAALQAVGFAKLGYAGVLLAGCVTPALLEQFLLAYQQLDQEITSYDDWRNRWLQLNEDLAMTPPADHVNSSMHYLYKNLLQPEQPLYSKNVSEYSDSEITEPDAWTSLKAAILAPQGKGLLAKAAHSLIKPDERLSECFGLDNASCPKRLTAGPCGNAQPDGFCEANHAPCFFNQIARIAAQRNELENREKMAAEPGNSPANTHS